MGKFNFFPKNESTTNYGKFEPSDANMLGYELENTIKNNDLVPNTYEQDQLSKSISNRVSLGGFYNDVTSDYSHIVLSITSPFKAPTKYINGMIVSFLPKQDNLIDATINVNGLGEKKILDSIEATSISAGKIKSGKYTQLVYNEDLNAFIIFTLSSENSSSGSGQLPIGSLVYSSIPLSDKSLMLANGDLLYKDSAQAEFFSKLQSIYDTTPDKEVQIDDQTFTIKEHTFVSQEYYDYQIQKTGNCHGYVLTERDVSIRIPTINGWVKGVNNLESIDTLSAELPNIKGLSVLGNSEFSQNTGAFTYQSATRKLLGTASNAQDNCLAFNASLSNSIYTDNARVQPDGVAYLVYIVVGNEIQETVSVIQDYEINNTIPLGCPIYLDHMVEDINYILSDNTWKDGTMYQTLYETLQDQYSKGTDNTRQFGDYSITFKKTPLDYNIVLLGETNTEELINNIYNEYKSTFWVLDTTNNRFKVPQNTSRVLVESWVEGEGWYNLYNDGWLEQGGYNLASSSGTIINLFKSFADTNYSVFTTGHDSTTTAKSINVSRSDNTQNSIKLIGWASGSYGYWKTCGYAELTDTFNTAKYLYYKAGNTTVNVEIINVDRLNTEVDKRVLKDGSNASFDNLSIIAQENILSSVLGNLQTEDETKVGYIKYISTGNKELISLNTITIPNGGTWFVYNLSFASTGDLGVRGALSRTGFFAGGTTIVSNQGTLLCCGFMIKVQ